MDSLPQEVKHSQPPWTAVKDGWAYDVYSPERVTERGDYGSIVSESAYCVASGIERETDARLITAAPDLVAACESLVRMYGHLEDNSEDEWNLFDTARAAIAKARQA